MFSFNELMSLSLHIWLVAFVFMISYRIIHAVMIGVRRGKIIAEIKTNVNKKLAEIDDDMQKYYNYEVYNDDISNNSNDNETKRH